MSDDPSPESGSRWLRPSRMEAFSDGVFAIAITLLVLDLAVPEPGSGVGHALLDQWPLFTAYVVSFASVGAVWIAHSTITNHLERVDSVLLRLNLLLLFFVSVLPFPTKMLAEFIGEFGPERIAVTIYGINLLAMSAMTSVVWRHAVAEGMLSGEHPQDEVQEVTKKLTPSLGFYAAAIAIGLLAPRLAVFLYLAIALYLLIPFHVVLQRRRRRTHSE
ncbi:MAG: TMEM175 family protein [Actinomycetota bacterium]